LHEVEKAGDGTEYVTLTKVATLADSLPSTAIKAVINGPMNSTDFKYLRQLVNSGNLLSIDLADVAIKSGGKAYYESYTCPVNTIGTKLFYGCTKLTNINLPENTIKINSNAFANSGLTGIFIPHNVTNVLGDAFAYCNSLETVVIGSKAKNLAQGVFYQSPVKHVYVYATTPPSVSAYLFSSNPVIHVYASSLAAYNASGWADYGTIVGDLDSYTAIEAPVVNEDNTDEADATIYDLNGRTVKELQPGKIYVRKGKKFIAK
jgi:hypothetical protein